MDALFTSVVETESQTDKKRRNKLTISASIIALESTSNPQPRIQCHPHNRSWDITRKTTSRVGDRMQSSNRFRSVRPKIPTTSGINAEFMVL